MEPGAIVEFSTADGPRVGVVTGHVGKQKLRVVTASGDERRPSATDISLQLRERVAPDDERAVAAALARLERAAEEQAADIDLAAVWHTVSDEASLSLLELARRALGDDSDPVVLATLRALRDDEVYFRHRRGAWERRSEQQVEQNLQQRDARRGRDATRRAFVEIVCRLSLPDADASLGELTASEDHRALFDLITQYAVAAEGFTRAAQAEALLDEIEEARGREFRMGGTLRGFELMVELGVWGEHELLSVHRFGVRLEHDGAALHEASERAGEPWSEAERRDMTDWWTITVDDQSTRDIDDALSLRPTLEGGWQLAVHIADPTVFIARGSSLDQYAESRGTSIYLPDGVASMLPAAISERAASLVEGERRPALTALVSFDAELEIEGVELFESVVQVNRRMSYSEVDRRLESGPDDFLTEILVGLRYLADELLERRRQRGAITLRLSESVVRVRHEATGPQVTLSVASTGPGRDIVSEMMLLFGEQLALAARHSAVPLLFRGQESSNADRADRDIAGIPEGPAREIALLKRMQRATLSLSPRPHEGLGLSCYAQATSPIRRYGDLVVHRQIKAHLRGDPLPYSEAELWNAARSAERASAQAAVIENEARRYWTLFALRQMEGETVEAVVVSAGDKRGRTDVYFPEWGFRATVKLRSSLAVGARVRLQVTRARPRRDLLSVAEVH